MFSLKPTTFNLVLSILLATGLSAQPPLDSLKFPAVSAKATSEKGKAKISLTYDARSYTFWESEAYFPSDFFSRDDRNLLLSKNSISRVQKSSNITSAVSSSTSAAMDGSVFSSTYINSGRNKYWYKISLANPKHLAVIALKASVASDIDIYSFNTTGDSTIIGSYDVSDHYSEKRIPVNQNSIAIKLMSKKPFLLFEIGAMDEIPHEDLVYTFVRSKRLKAVELDFKACTTADSVHIDLSEDSISWTTIARPDPTKYFATAYATNFDVHGKFLRVRYFLNASNYSRGKLAEITFYGTDYEKTPIDSGKTRPSAWDPLAGLWPAYSDSIKVVSSYINKSHPISNVMDKSEATGWKSAPAFPSAYLSRTDRNLMLDASLISSSTRSNGGTFNYWNDGDPTTGDQISASQGNRRMKINFSKPTHFHLISLKTSVMSSIDMIGYLPNGDSISLGTNDRSSHYKLERYILSKTLIGIGLRSSQDFIVFELGGIEYPMYEDIVADFSYPRDIGWVYTSFHNSQWIDSVLFQVSNDSVLWTTVARPDPTHYFEYGYKAEPNKTARYTRLRIFIKEKDYARAELYEFYVRDRHGLYGPMAPPKMAKRPLAEMMGINGIRGWGHGYGSHGIGDTVQGAYLFSNVASYGRNYQNLSWDTHDPDFTPNYNNMPGGLRFGYVDWDVEYDIWNDAGLDVQVTLQFLNSSQPEHIWDDPWTAAYNIGYAFASHFGPTYGVGNVFALEVGNEPWDYSKEFYRTVLNGMARGAKDADPAMKVFSGALQAADPGSEWTHGGDFIGERLTETEAPYLDGVNSHHYSYMIDPVTQKRISTYPENPNGQFRSMICDIRFRDHNMPGKEYHVTEWGWGAPGAGQNCTQNECVTERAQAIYGARGLFMMDRLGVDKATWYFYANLPYESGLVYSRSGLTGPVITGSEKRPVYYVFETIKNVLGGSYFLNVINEDENAWAYTYGDSLGNPEYIVAWRPVAEADNASQIFTINTPYTVISALQIDGTPGGTITPLPSRSSSGSSISFPISNTPVVLKLKKNTLVTKKSSTYKPKPIEGLNLELYPNPNNGQFILDFDLPIASKATVRVMSLEGRIVHQEVKNLNEGHPNIEMQLNHLAKGTYMIETTVNPVGLDSEQTFRQKLIITQ